LYILGWFSAAHPSCTGVSTLAEEFTPYRNPLNLLQTIYQNRVIFRIHKQLQDVNKLLIETVKTNMETLYVMCRTSVLGMTFLISLQILCFEWRTIKLKSSNHSRYSVLTIVSRTTWGSICILLLPGMEWTLLRVLKLQCMMGEQQKITRVCTIKMSLFTVKRPENWPERIWSSIFFLLLDRIDSNLGQFEIWLYTL
jgi:hypothetical protein